jgi:hypothetical protein
VETLPLREDEYDAQRDRLLAQLNRGVIRQVAAEWLDPTRIRDRNGFAFVQ